MMVKSVGVALDPISTVVKHMTSTSKLFNFHYLTFPMSHTDRKIVTP